jgi:hypothetical protein
MALVLSELVRGAVDVRGYRRVGVARGVVAEHPRAGLAAVIEIKTDAQNELALKALEKLLDALNGEQAGDETLCAWTGELSNAIESYESVRFGDLFQ